MKKPAKDALKTGSKRAIQKIAEATADLIGNKITNKTEKKSPQNNSDIGSRLLIDSEC